MESSHRQAGEAEEEGPDGAESKDWREHQESSEHRRVAKAAKDAVLRGG